MSQSFTVEGNTLKIHDFQDRFDYWTSQDWREDITAVFASDGVTEIPDGTFQYFKSLAEVRLPASLKSIIAYARI